MVNYVKFIRGTQAAFNKLNKKDDDTLYFISETKDSDIGQLYLGNKLISGISTINLNDIENVIIRENILPNSILVFDMMLNKWVSRSLPEAIRESGYTLADMIGATANTNGKSGLVPGPVIGDENKYLRGDGTWSNPTAVLEAKIPQVETRITNLDTLLQQVSLNQSILSLKLVETTNKLNNLNYKTVLLESKVIDLQSALTTLSHAQLDISQLTSVVKQEINNLSFTKVEFNAQVGDLKLLYSYNPFLNDDELITIVEDINDLDERLRWIQIDQQKEE